MNRYSQFLHISPIFFVPPDPFSQVANYIYILWFSNLQVTDIIKNAKVIFCPEFPVQKHDAM